MIKRRGYTGVADLSLMVALLTAVRPARWLADYPSPLDLHELLALTQVQDSTRLWFDAQERLVAYALVDHNNNLCFEINEHASCSRVDDEIIAWAESCIRGRTSEEDDTPTLDAACREEDPARVAWLTGRGFAEQPERGLRFVRSLREPIPPPRLPSGFRIRHVAGEEEVEALVALHRAAFGTTEMTVEERLAMMRVPGYDPALDLVVVTPEGQSAAYCVCTISEDENKITGRRVGYTDPVGTHPDFQRRGLATALLLTGMHLLRARGMDSAALGTSSTNVAMQRTAAGVGFEIEASRLWFARPV